MEKRERNEKKAREKGKEQAENNNKKLNDRLPAILIITLYVNGQNTPIKRDCRSRNKTRKN